MFPQYCIANDFLVSAVTLFFSHCSAGEKKRKFVLSCSGVFTDLQPKAVIAIVHCTIPQVMFHHSVYNLKSDCVYEYADGHGDEQSNLSLSLRNITVPWILNWFE